MIEVHEVSDILVDEVRLETSQYGTEVTVEITDSSIEEAAVAIVDAVNEKFKDDRVVVRLKTKMNDLESNAFTKIKSTYINDWLQAYADMSTAHVIKNILDEVGA